MRGAAIVFLFALVGCLEEVPERVALQPSAEQVEFVVDTPNPRTFALVGKVTGIAAANDPDNAAEAAKNDLRNHAAALGASLVKIDEDTGEALPFQDRTKVKLVGRAYKAID